MTYNEYKILIKTDLGRLVEKDRISKYCVCKYLFDSSAFQISFWFRTAHFLLHKKGISKILYFFVKRIYKHYCVKYGIRIPIDTTIGPGLFIPHYGCSQLNAHKVGKNFTLYQSATVGSVRGKGKPIIGDNVVVASAAQVIGEIKIGNNVMIGTAAVVVKDIPDNAVVVGNPARIINYKGKENVAHYINPPKHKN